MKGLWKCTLERNTRKSWNPYGQEFGYDIFQMCRGHQELSNVSRITQVRVLHKKL